MATWKDWRGQLPPEVEAVRFKRWTTGKVVIHATGDLNCELPGKTLCGVYIPTFHEGYDEPAFWTREQAVEETNLTPWADDQKVCRICNARQRKLKGGE